MAIPRNSIFQHVAGGSIGWMAARRTLTLPGRVPEREWVLVEFHRLSDGSWVPRRGGAVLPAGLTHGDMKWDAVAATLMQSMEIAPR